MIARSRRVRLRNGVEFQTPLLVPGLSGRALGPIPFEEEPRAKPKPTPCSIVHSLALVDGIDEALLISAYDIHHALIADSVAFQQGFTRSRYARPRVLIIDCGWYEKGWGPAGGVFIEGLDAPRPWLESDYERTIEQLDPDIRAAIVNWDRAGSYGNQIACAQSFFGKISRFSSIILLKPPHESRFHHLSRLSGDDFSNLRAFDVIGVTEKELGDTVIDRLVTLAKLRTYLDENDVQAPIQVFGGLDPLYTPLYFAAGGEIFDGLGWLRYAYRDGMSVNREASAILDGQVSKRWMQALHMVSLQNLDAMRVLTAELRVFAHSQGDWSKISSKGEVFRPIYEQLEEQLTVHLGGRYGR